MLCLIGTVLAAMVFCIRTEYLEKMAWPLLIAALVLLFAVLVPGLGHVVNGSRRWIRVLGFNFQASELARVLTLIFIASYAVRREDELRSTAFGLVKPIGLLVFVALLLLAEPDFGAASVLFVTGFGILFIAGAQAAFRVGGGRAGRRCGRAAGDAGAVPHGARHLVSRSVGRSVQQRLPAHAVADRHRARRVVRRRAGRERAEALLSTRGAHRLPVRGAGRGAGPGGRGGDAGAVHRRWCGAASGSRSSRRAPASSSRPISPRVSVCGWARRR